MVQQRNTQQRQSGERLRKTWQRNSLEMIGVAATNPKKGGETRDSMGIITKCTVIPLSYIETEEIPFKAFCAEYFEIAKAIRTVKNKVSSDFWVRKTEDLRVHEETGVWPKFSKLKWANEEYHRYKGALPMYQTSHVSQLLQSEVNQLSAHWKDVLSGKRTIDNFKGDQPVVIKGDCLRLEYTLNGCEAVISLFSSAVKKKYPVKNGIVRFKLHLRSGSLKSIADRCVNGDYKIGASTLNYNRKKRVFELALTYSFEKEAEAVLDPDKVLGVDLGVSTAYYTATNFSYDRFYELGGDIEAFRKKTEAERWKRKKQRAVCGDGSIGHGRTKRMRPVEDISDKIARYRDTKNHLMARKIVSEAKRLNCGVIQMEDLTGISEENLFLKSWSYYDLQQKVKSKALEEGITVRMVEPAYTSQRCSQCGHIAEENRPKNPSWSLFKCTRCGYETNADYNAARNIATPGIAEVIKEASAKRKLG